MHDFFMLDCKGTRTIGLASSTSSVYSGYLSDKVPRLSSSVQRTNVSVRLLNVRTTRTPENFAWVLDSG